MGKTIGKIIYVIVAAFFIFVMIKGGLQTSRKTLKNIAENIVVLENGEVLPENEGKLVLVSGNVSVDEKSLKDEEYNVEVEDAIFLNRVAYQYRWYTFQEEERYKTYEEDYNGKRVEVEKTRTVTKLTKGWLIADGKEEENIIFNKENHYNPYSKISSLRQMGTIHLGDFILDDNSFKLTNFSDNFEYYDDLEDGYNSKMGKYVKAEDNNHKAYITTGNEIGDFKIEFCYLNASKLGNVTIVGKQSGNRIVEYNEDNINLFECYNKKISKGELISKLEEDFNNAKIGIIVVAVILIIVGAFVFYEDIANIIEKRKAKQTLN